MAEGVLLSKRDADRLQAMLREFEKNKPAPRFRRDRGGRGSQNIKLAKTQEAAQTDGEISVKLLDSSLNETAPAFDVFVFPDGAATDFTSDYILSDTGAAMASGKQIEIFKAVNGSWYMVSPVLIKITTVLVVGNFSSGDSLDLSGGKLRATQSTLTVIKKTSGTKTDTIDTTTCGA